jgi:thiol-disulfide isomerase/thioredoxin
MATRWSWKYVPALVVTVLALSVGVAGQVPSIVTEVREAIARQDFVAGERLVAARRAATGVTPVLLEAQSWLARAALAAGRLDTAEAYAQRTYDEATALLKKRALDADLHLPVALGAAIEVLGQVTARQGARSEAVAFLDAEVARYANTSIEKRLRKNLHLLSLEGTRAPGLDLSEPLAGQPAARAALTGRVTLLFFWAHWCSDCKAQEPVIGKVLQKYGGQGLAVIAPTQRFGYVAGGRDAGAAEETTYIGMVRRNAYPSLAQVPVPLAEANHRRYGVSTTPTLVLVDRQGLVRMYHPGGMTEKELDAAVRQVLDRP